MRTRAPSRGAKAMRIAVAWIWRLVLAGILMLICIAGIFLLYLRHWPRPSHVGDPRWRLYDFSGKITRRLTYNPDTGQVFPPVDTIVDKPDEWGRSFEFRQISGPIWVLKSLGEDPENPSDDDSQTCCLEVGTPEHPPQPVACCHAHDPYFEMPRHEIDDLECRLQSVEIGMCYADVLEIIGPAMSDDIVARKENSKPIGRWMRFWTVKYARYTSSERHDRSLTLIFDPQDYLVEVVRDF